MKRLKPERRKAIPGVLAYCRKVFEQQVPFDYSFDLDDSALYCLEMTEKAFRSQGLALSEPVRLGDMENATRYPICISLFVSLSPLVLKKPLTLEQAVYMPGNGRHGMWASPLLEAVYSPPADRNDRGHPSPGRPTQPGGRPRDRRGHRERIPDERQAAVATGGSVRPRFARIQGRGRLRLPPDGLGRLPPRHRGPGGQLLRRVPVLLARSEDGPELGRDPVPDPRPRLRPLQRVRLGRAARVGASNTTGPTSDATTGDLIATGQHTGLAAQVARGDVGLVFVFIGGNDFIDAMSEPDPEAALREALPRALANYRLAVGTIRAADPDVRLVLATVPDIRLLPEFAGPLREGRLPARLADACTAAMGRYNAQIRAMAAGDRRVALLDLALVARLADLVSRDYAVVAGRRLDRSRPGNSPDRFFLADRRHPGTLAQAELARLFILAVNARFGAGIEPLRDAEILGLVDDPLAGRAGSSPSWPGGRGALPDPAVPGPAGRPVRGLGTASLPR